MENVLPACGHRVEDVCDRDHDDLEAQGSLPEPCCDKCEICGRKIKSEVLTANLLN